MWFFPRKPPEFSYRENAQLNRKRYLRIMFIRDLIHTVAHYQDLLIKNELAETVKV